MTDTSSIRSVLLVASEDPHLEAMLRAATASVTTVAADDAGSAPKAAAAVVDVRSADGLPPCVQALRRRQPSVGIVLIAARLEPQLMLEAMRAGVNECLVEPIEPAALRDALARVAGANLPDVPGETFVFLGAKGGVGTTTVAVNVATALGMLAPSSVLLIDLHLAGGDAALFLGAEPRFSVFDALENTARLDEAFLRSLVVRTGKGVDLLASADRLTGTAVTPQAIRALLDFTATRYRYTIIDAPRGDPAVLDSLDRAGTLSVVTSQELTAVRSAGRLTTSLRGRYGRERVKLVVNRYDASAAIGQDEVEHAVQAPVRQVLPSNYRLAVHALNAGEPLVIKNHNPLAGAYVGYARALAGLTAATAAPKQGGLLGRLTGRR